MSGLKDVDYVLRKLDFMRAERIWPNGLRYLWTDAFGVILLVSLYQALKDDRYLDEAERLVAEVERVLGRKRGIRIGSVKDGKVVAYIPDPNENATNTSAAEGITVDAKGNIYGAEVGPKALKKYVKQ